jgi:uncharacterized protein
MQRCNGTSYLFAATDLVHFLGCHHRAVLDVRSFDEPLQRAADADQSRLLQKKGFAHEAAYLTRLRGLAATVVEIPKGPSLAERVRLTTKALQAGADVIFQAALQNESWRGDADFLVKIAGPSALGDFTYEVEDTKLAMHAEPKHVMQL